MNCEACIGDLRLHCQVECTAKDDRANADALQQVDLRDTCKSYMAPMPSLSLFLPL